MSLQVDGGVVQLGDHLSLRSEGEPAARSSHKLSFSFVYDGGGMAKGGVGTLSVDGKSASTHALTAPFVHSGVV